MQWMNFKDLSIQYVPSSEIYGDSESDGDYGCFYIFWYEELDHA